MLSVAGVAAEAACLPLPVPVNGSGRTSPALDDMFPRLQDQRCTCQVADIPGVAAPALLFSAKRAASEQKLTAKHVPWQFLPQEWRNRELLVICA
jgi:hypothetical protein